MESYNEGPLRIDVEPREDALVLHFRGKSAARDPDASLRPFFERVADEASRGAGVVELRLDALEYFNSSTIAAMIRAIRRFHAQRTRVSLTYPDQGWQRRSLDALRMLLEQDGVLENAGGAA